jgi:hypothetical protein
MPTPLGIRIPTSLSSVDVVTDMANMAADIDTLLTLQINKPAFHLTQVGVAQNILNNTFTSITFNTEAIDVPAPGGHDLVTNTSRYTVQTGHGGLWLVSAKQGWDGNTTGRRLSRFLINGATVVPGSEHSVPPASTALLQPVATYPVRLSAGDYIEFQQAQDSGGTRTTYLGTADSGAAFWGVRIGS